MTGHETDREDCDSGPGADYDPFTHVPDRIDQISASGLVQLHEALSEQNRDKLRSVPVETQASLLWALVDDGTIDVDLTVGRPP